MDEPQPCVGAHHRCESRSHAPEARLGVDEAAELVLDAADGVAEDLEQVASRLVLVEHRKGGHRDRASDLAGRRTPHAVGDDEKMRPCVAAVLVAVTQQAHIGAGGVAQGQRHRRSCPFTCAAPSRSSRSGWAYRVGVT